MPHAKLPRPKLIDDSAFAIQRVKPHVEKPDFMFRSKVHGDWIRTLPCSRCAVTPVEAAHIRYDTQTAKGVKPHDYWMWPGCPRCHRGIQHQIGEITYWVSLCGIADPHKFILVQFAMHSPCEKTRIAAKDEYERRYPDTRPLSGAGV